MPQLQAQLVALGAEFDRMRLSVARDMGRVRGAAEAERVVAAEERAAAAVDAAESARRQEAALRALAAREEQTIRMRWGRQGGVVT
jgi:hypothetical protein